MDKDNSCTRVKYNVSLPQKRRHENHRDIFLGEIHEIVGSHLFLKGYQPELALVEKIPRRRNIFKIIEMNYKVKP